MKMKSTFTTLVLTVINKLSEIFLFPDLSNEKNDKNSAVNSLGYIYETLNFDKRLGEKSWL